MHLRGRSTAVDRCAARRPAHHKLFKQLCNFRNTMNEAIQEFPRYAIGFWNNCILKYCFYKKNQAICAKAIGK